jgi:hypothetical protein
MGPELVHEKALFKKMFPFILRRLCFPPQGRILPHPHPFSLARRREFEERVDVP